MAAAPPQSIHDLDYAGVVAALADGGVVAHHAKALWRALHRDGALTLHEQAFSPPLRRWVDAMVGDKQRYFLDDPVVLEESHSADGLTHKFLLRLRDGQTIETVLMGYDGRHTVCVSTQAGCAMACQFCATGQLGFSRHLRPGEIVAQVHLARRRLAQSHPHCRLRNVVTMGMGEPLHNLDAVLRALNIISDVRGLSIGPSKIALSTVGLVPGILQLARDNHPYHLAVSLHATTDDQRNHLIPAARRWPLAELLDACRQYHQTTGKRIFFQWTLIAGVNDSSATARHLAALLTGIGAHVNLIPLNPTHGYHGTASRDGRAFQQIILNAGIPCTFRQRRGIDAAAGCGMLSARKA